MQGSNSPGSNPVSNIHYSFTGRHTFATVTCLANGVTIENVAKILGHSDTKMTQQYAKVLDKSILRDMRNVNSTFLSKKK